jgi:hypothetical protein
MKRLKDTVNKDIIEMSSENINSWIFKTHVTPNDVGVESESQVKYKEMYSKAYQILLQECCIDEEEVSNKVERMKHLIDNRSGKPHRKFRIQIDASGDNDIIDIGVEYHVVFLKSKFLGNKHFKNDLIKHYKPLGLYVNGPNNKYGRTDTSNTGKWYIDLCWS